MSPTVKRWKRKILNGLAVHVFGRWILPVLVRSWSFETNFPGDWLAKAESGQRAVLAFWHNRQIGLLRLVGTLEPVHVLVSRHGDGEIIARIMGRFGVEAVRGSSTRGGGAALRQMVALTRRSHLAITPDGPVGPRYSVKEGVVYLAALSKLPVFAVSWSTNRAWIFDSWDRFMLPKPFAHLRFHAIGPFFAETADDPGHVEAVRANLERSMREQTARLDSASGLTVDPLLSID